MRYNITLHSRLRYVERVAVDLTNTDNILPLMLQDLKDSKDITNKIYNDYPRYILHLHETFKGANQIIMENKDKHVWFILKKKPGTLHTYDVLTCYKRGDAMDQFKSSVLSRQEIFIRITMAKKANKHLSY